MRIYGNNLVALENRVRQLQFLVEYMRIDDAYTFRHKFKFILIHLLSVSKVFFLSFFTFSSPQFGWNRVSSCVTLTVLVVSQHIEF